MRYSLVIIFLLEITFSTLNNSSLKYWVLIPETCKYLSCMTKTAGHPPYATNQGIPELREASTGLSTGASQRE